MNIESAKPCKYFLFSLAFYLKYIYICWQSTLYQSVWLRWRAKHMSLIKCKIK